jgi:small subunit ribosomal protein S19
MSRSKWKGPFIDSKHFRTIQQLKKQQNNKNRSLIMTRNSEIVPSLIGLTLNIHNGKSYSEILVTENMVGHKFGEFAFTRSKFLFKKKKQKK